MVIQNKYSLGQEVYLKTDPEQQMRIVTGIIVNPGDLVYELSQGKEMSRHYDFEITEQQDELTKVR